MTLSGLLGHVRHAICFRQALAGEPELVESLPKPMDRPARSALPPRSAETAKAASFFCWMRLDPGGAAAGRGRGPEGGWAELLREVCRRRGRRVAGQSGQEVPGGEVRGGPRKRPGFEAFQLKSGDRAWTILVRDEVQARRWRRPLLRLPRRRPQPGRSDRWSDPDEARFTSRARA